MRTTNEVWRVPCRAQSSWVQRTGLSGSLFGGELVPHVAAQLPLECVVPAPDVRNKHCLCSWNKAPMKCVHHGTLQQRRSMVTQR